MKCYNKKCEHYCEIAYPMTHCRNASDMSKCKDFIGDDKMQMTDKIQMTEEEWSNFYDDMDGKLKCDKGSFIYILKQNGYIKKSNLEIAEENYKSWYSFNSMNQDIKPAVYLIEQLYEEREKLKNK